MEEINELKSNIPQEQLFSMVNSENKITNLNKNRLLHWVIVLINICSLLLCWFIEGNKHGVVSVDIFLEVFDWKYLMFAITLVLIILMLRSFLDFINIYRSCKRRCFRVLFVANSKMDFYNFVTSYLYGGNVVYLNYLGNRGVSQNESINSLYCKKVFSRISNCIYSLCFLLIGLFLFAKTTNIFLFVIAILTFLFNCLWVITVFLFNTQREKIMSITASICKILFKLRLIRDYERVFKLVNHKLYVANYNLRVSGKVSIIYIILNIIRQFMRHFILFVLLQMMNNGSCEILFEILFKCAILDLIVLASPLPYGTALYELVFVILFRNVFDIGYVLWAMVLYRLLDYFIYILVYVFMCIFNKKNKNCSLKK